jgi:GT2 family glycosyltransferase
VKASVVIPTARGGERLARLLESLEPHSYQVIVVDNGSREEVAAKLSTRFPSVEVIRRERNEGFSIAVNLGARQADGEALVLLNDDCVCDAGFVSALVGALDRDREIVMSAAILRRWREPWLIESAGMELDHTLLVWEHLHAEPLDVLAGDVTDPIGPSAAAAAFDREAFLDVGGFDEELFAYWEDVDLVLRFRLQGGRCALATGARGTHEHAATLGSGSAAKNYLMGFGRTYVLRKWGAAGARRLPAILARDVPICVGQAIFDRNIGGIRGRIAGYRAARPSYPYPADVVAAHGTSGALTTLRRRARRRARPRPSLRRAE